MPENVIHTVRNISDIANIQYENFMNNHVLKYILPIHIPNKKNKLPPFKTSNTKGQSKSKAENEELKLHVRHFSEMYV